MTNNINKIVYEQCGIAYTKKHDLVVLHIELDHVSHVQYNNGMTYTLSDFEFITNKISPDKIIKIENLNIVNNL